jgi:hypothetical protein
MKAEEMFKELGFIKNKSTCYNETNVLYEKPIKNEYGDCDIESVHFENGYFIYTSTFKTPLKTYGEILRAIYKQMQELGWMDVGDEMIRFYELEEKATPKKPYKENSMLWCSVCDANVLADNNYCHECGQRLDWSDYD